jgi:hypothetical protein
MIEENFAREIALINVFNVDECDKVNSCENKS